MNSIGKKIAKLRKQANITQDELAEALEVTRQSVSQWESDAVIPKADKIKALCGYFNVRADYFLFEDCEAQPLTHTENTVKPLSKKRAFIISATVISLLALSVILFIVWLSTSATAQLSEYFVICLIVLSCIILLTVFSILIAVVIRYKRKF